jgi:hypothetical protein
MIPGILVVVEISTSVVTAFSANNGALPCFEMLRVANIRELFQSLVMKDDGLEAVLLPHWRRQADHPRFTPEMRAAGSNPFRLDL